MSNIIKSHIFSYFNVWYYNDITLILYIKKTQNVSWYINGEYQNSFILQYASELLKMERDSAQLVSSEITMQLRNYMQPFLEINDDVGVFIIAPDYKSVFSMRNGNIPLGSVPAIATSPFAGRPCISTTTHCAMYFRPVSLPYC